MVMDSDVLAVIPSVPGNYSSNLVCDSTIKPCTHKEGCLMDCLNEKENKTGDGRGERESVIILHDGRDVFVFCRL